MSADTVAVPPAQLETNAVPPAWRRATLGELVERLYSGGTPSTREAAHWSGSTPWITGADIVGQKVTPVRRHVTPDAIVKGMTQVVPKGGVLIVTRTGVGKVAVAPFDVAVSQDITGAIPKPNQITGDYLYWWLIRNASQLARLNQGTSINGVVRGDLATLQVLVPPLEEQQRITEVLSSIEVAIEETDVVTDATERLRQALTHELLTRGVPGWHHEWKQVPGIGEVPIGWKVVRLGDVCMPPEYGAGASAIPYDPSLPRYVRITDIDDSGHLRSDNLRSSEIDHATRYELRDGDLLFARSGATVGKTYIYREIDGPCVFAGYLIRFRPLPQLVMPGFLFLLTRVQFYRTWVERMLRAGAQPNINASEYSSLLIPLPPVEEQVRILDVCDGVSQPLCILSAEQQVLAGLKEQVADMLLSGKMRVSVAEPARL